MQLRSIETIFRALNDAQVKYLVVGGLAVVAHGYVRTTEDVDLVISLAPDNIKCCLAVLESIGYRMGVPITAEQFADETQRKLWREEKGMLVLKLWSDSHNRTPIDVFVYEPFDLDEELEQASKVALSDHLEVPVVSLPTLLRMKREAGRPQDLADIDELEKLA